VLPVAALLRDSHPVRRLQTVDLWYLDKHPPTEVAFGRSGQRVAFLLSEILPDLELAAKHSFLRIFADSGATDGAVEVGPVILGGSTHFHSARVQLPPQVLDLSPDSRGLLVLDVCMHVLRLMGQELGWPQDQLDEARDYVLDRALQYAWNGPWTSSPDRRRKARLAAEVPDNAEVRTYVEVTDGDGWWRSEASELGSHGDTKIFKARAKSLRWDGPDSVSYEFWPPRSLTPDRHRHIVGTLLPPPHVVAPLLDLTEARPLVRDLVPTNPHELRFTGGGDLAFAPREYTAALWQTFDQLREPAWAEWWAAAEAGPLWVGFWLGGSRPVSHGVRTKASRDLTRKGTYLDATFSRPSGSVDKAADHAAVATADLVALMEKVRRRTGLGPPPEVRRVDIDLVVLR
jgi:hypothetical protein